MPFQPNLVVCAAILALGWPYSVGSPGPTPDFSGKLPSLASVRIETTPGRAISSTFMGLSHEWYDSPKMMGSSQTGINSIYRQLLKNLTAYGSGPINLRIGGDSTDKTKEPVAATIKPFAEVARTVGAHFTLGVNLGSGNVDLAIAQVRAYLSQMPSGSVDGIEIGNEPDEYYKNGMRQSTYTVQDYFADFDRWKASILPLLPPGTKLVGGAWAFTGTMKPNIQSFLSREAGTLGGFSQHYYATNPAASPADDFLLSPRAATVGPSEVASAVATTHAHGIPFRMGEFSSISNAGVRGISDAFGVALWSVDTMFEYANAGVDGVNWESSAGNYDNPFYFATGTVNGKSTYALRSVNPLYYGLLFFQAATGHQARLLAVNLATRANLKAWATVDSLGTPRLALINKDKTLAGSVAVTLPGYTHASILRLTAPSYTSTEGVAFGGQTLDGSIDGTLQGSRSMETVSSGTGVFQIPISVTSAALVTFTR